MKSVKPQKIELKQSISIGVVSNSEKIDEFEFKADKNTIAKIWGAGEYVLARNSHGNVILGVITNITSNNSLISNELTSCKQLEDAIPYSNKIMDDSTTFTVKVKILGVIHDGKIESNSNCASILGKAYLAGDELLKSIFSNGNIEIGHLKVRKSVPVYLNARTLCSRHFAILAMTGAGKSNTVAVITEKLHEKTKGMMNIVIIDPHGEYINMKQDSEVNILKPYWILLKSPRNNSLN